MVRKVSRPVSRYSEEAIALLGLLLHNGRIEQRLTANSLAERAGISRSLLYRIERGDPSCAIGSVFEVAAILRVPLFDSDLGSLAAQTATTRQRTALLPKAVRRRNAMLDDDF